MAGLLVGGLAGVGGVWILVYSLVTILTVTDTSAETHEIWIDLAPLVALLSVVVLPVSLFVGWHSPKRAQERGG
jgi:hypothetical protein